MRVLGAIFLVLGLVFLQADRVYSQEGKEGTEFAPKNMIFTIKMPGENSDERAKILMIGRHKVAVEVSASVSKDGTKFLGAAIGIPAVVLADLPRGKHYDILRDAIVKQLKGKVAKETAIKTDNVPGKEYEIEQLNGVARMRLYTIAGFVTYAIIEGKKEQVNSKQADAFFTSLKFTERGKEFSRQVNP